VLLEEVDQRRVLGDVAVVSRRAEALGELLAADVAKSLELLLEPRQAAGRDQRAVLDVVLHRHRAHRRLLSLAIRRGQT